MNPLTKVACERVSQERKWLNYLIAGVCGIIIGVMLGVSI